MKELKRDYCFCVLRTKQAVDNKLHTTAVVSKATLDSVRAWLDPLILARTEEEFKREEKRFLEQPELQGIPGIIVLLYTYAAQCLSTSTHIRMT
ncbi:hypothetical protein GPECTOR_9g638 [Gonium pectorale]|uniref:Uncharacterized protein n=1 Tax=Gonium pectorale TaxID=33097 RepID=A0A150GS02_GONPE|nr:hypothetical protein GPECTOR_9g638 [Gonium pectorale]|eukprot:KXZ52593.1 hypothetical protein GPECTOR_9g638 [Gonium pectorale]